MLIFEYSGSALYSRVTNNKNVAITNLNADGILATILQNTSATPGIRIDDLTLQPYGTYLLTVHGTDDAGITFLWAGSVGANVNSLRGDTPIVATGTTGTFKPETALVDIGVLTTNASVGDSFTITSIKLEKQADAADNTTQVRHMSNMLVVDLDQTVIGNKTFTGSVNMSTLTVSDVLTVNNLTVSDALTVTGEMVLQNLTVSDTITVNTLTITGSSGVDDLNIDTTTGDFVVSGSNAIILSTTLNESESINLHANGGTSETIKIHADQGTGTSSINILSDVGGITLTSGLSSADAINLVASGSGGGIDVDTGTGGVIVDTVGGAISLDAQGASSNFSLAATASSQDLTISTTGAFDTSLIISSSGTANNQRRVKCSASAGGIDVDAGTGGVIVDAAGGAISLDAQGVSSNFSLAATASSQDLTIATTGAFDTSLIISSSGTAGDAIRITGTAAGGGIDVDTSTGAIDIDTTTGAITLDTAGGAISLDAQGASSNLSLAATASSQDLTIATTGAFDTSLVLSSSGTAADAVRINASASAGGIDVDAGTGGVVVDTAGGAISLDAQGASSNFSLAATASSQDLTIATTGAFDTSLIISSSGTGTDAIRIVATAAGGG